MALLIFKRKDEILFEETLLESNIPSEKLIDLQQRFDKEQALKLEIEFNEGVTVEETHSIEDVPFSKVKSMTVTIK